MTAMTNDATATAARTTPAPLLKSIGLTGRVAVTWSMAGGILLGGVLVALMTLTGQLSGHGIFMTSTGLFVIGALLGAAHGAILGLLGRPAGVERHEALSALGRAALYAVPGATVAWLLTVWIAMSAVAAYLDRPAPLVLVGLAWLGGVSLVATATTFGVRALGNAYGRWPERQLGTVVVAGAFAALLLIFLADRPSIWLLRLRVTDVGAVLSAAMLAIWVVGPLVTLALRLVPELPGRSRMTVGLPDRHTAINVGLGLVVGLLVGLLTVPFAGPAAGMASGAAGGTVVAVAHAVVDEVLLRLVLLTGVAWLILRWHRVHGEEAAILAVGAVAIIQVLLYLPGVVAAGFPTALAAVSFTGAVVLVPALVFGAVYWKRGLTAAVVADATAALALLLLI
jgi:hypothetical protein